MMQQASDNPALRIKNALRRFDRYRKNKMANFANLMLSCIANQRDCQPSLLPANEVRQILIVRSNDRVGNTVFLIPFIRQVQHYYPNAKITLLVNKPWQKDLFAHLGIEQFVFAQLAFSSLLHCINTVIGLRQSTFDLCLSPSISAQSAIFCALLRARNKVSYSSRYDPAFTHTVPVKKHDSHAALCNLSLLAQLHPSATPFNHSNSHQLVIDHEEHRRGWREKHSLTHRDGLCIAFFRGARGDKKLSASDWLNILHQFERSARQPIYWVEIMGPEIDAPLRGDITTYRSQSLRSLACFLRHTDGFISCDTGPLHLADAAGVSCIGLYTHTDPAVYGLLGEHCFHVADLNNMDTASILQTLSCNPMLPRVA